MQLENTRQTSSWIARVFLYSRRRIARHTWPRSIGWCTILEYSVIISGCKSDTGRLNSAKKGTLQNSVMRACTFSYSASVMSGTESSRDGTPGLRLSTLAVVSDDFVDFLPVDALDFLVLPLSLAFLAGVLRFFGADLGVFALIISLLLLTAAGVLEGLIGFLSTPPLVSGGSTFSADVDSDFSSCWWELVLLEDVSLAITSKLLGSSLAKSEYDKEGCWPCCGCGGAPNPPRVALYSASRMCISFISSICIRLRSNSCIRL
mmetsp:Transcript_25861/g.43848  ORF Transcript_25861/g.43848 Transcript_25861/m.43848 type:complete len:262 (-) Transcript_25861:248-1033(-)